jgi:hypothetical protein
MTLTVCVFWNRLTMKAVFFSSQKATALKWRFPVKKYANAIKSALDPQIQGRTGSTQHESLILAQNERWRQA